MRATKVVQKLRAELEKMTGRKPESFKERYLRRRLDAMKKRAEAGEDVTHKAESAVCSFSTTESGKAALEDIIELEKATGNGVGSMSKLVRAALAMWCAKRGYADAATLFGED